MRVVFRRCCGIDVQGDAVVACGLIQEEGHEEKEVRSFPLTSEGLLRLLDWLWARKVTHVAMSGTGGLWKPAFDLFEGTMTVLLIDPVQLKSLLGRPEALEDCEWIADLLSYGLLKGGFVPPEPGGDLRDLVRYRQSLAEERKVEIARLQRILEVAHFKFPLQLLDGEGFSVRALLEALFGGTAEPEVLADLARGRLGDQLPTLRQVLQQSIFPPYHRFMLEQMLAHLDLLHEAFGQVSQEVKNRIVPFGERKEEWAAAPETEPQRVEFLLRGRYEVIYIHGRKNPRSHGEGGWIGLRKSPRKRPLGSFPA